MNLYLCVYIKKKNCSRGRGEGRLSLLRHSKTTGTFLGSLRIEKKKKKNSTTRARQNTRLRRSQWRRPTRRRRSYRGIFPPLRAFNRTAATTRPLLTAIVWRLFGIRGVRRSVFVRNRSPMFERRARVTILFSGGFFFLFLITFFTYFSIDIRLIAANDGGGGSDPVHGRSRWVHCKL